MSEARWWSRLRGVFSRSRSDVKATSREVDRLRVQLDEAFSQQREQLARMRHSVADVSVSRRRLELQLNQTHADIADLDEQVKAAVVSGNDARARELLTRQGVIEERAESLGERHRVLAADEAKLHAQVETVEQRLEDFRINKDLLVARFEAARARGELHATNSAYAQSASEIQVAMDEARREAAALEATADGYEELIREGIITTAGETTDEALARRFDELLDDTETPGGGDDGPH